MLCMSSKKSIFMKLLIFIVFYSANPVDEMLIKKEKYLWKEKRDSDSCLSGWKLHHLTN
jgi:hypothetical protein